MNYRALAIAGFVFLAACATPTYAPPSAGPTATVMFTTPDKQIYNPVMLHTSKCTDKDAQLVGLLNSRAIGTPNVSSIETRLEAGKKASVSMITGRMTVALPKVTVESCRRIVDFLPDEGARYEISFYLAGGECKYDVLRVAADASGTVTRTPEPTAAVREDCKLPQHWAPFQVCGSCLWRTAGRLDSVWCNKWLGCRPQ